VRDKDQQLIWEAYEENPFHNTKGVAKDDLIYFQFTESFYNVEEFMQKLEELVTKDQHELWRETGIKLSANTQTGYIGPNPEEIDNEGRTIYTFRRGDIGQFEDVTMLDSMEDDIYKLRHQVPSEVYEVRNLAGTPIASPRYPYEITGEQVRKYFSFSGDAKVIIKKHNVRKGLQ